VQGGQEARSGLITRRAGPGQTAFRALDFGYSGISLLLLADNYNLTTNDFTTKARRHKGRAKRFEAGYGLTILAGRWAAAPGCRSTVAALPGFLLSLVAVARGPGLGCAIAWAGLPGRRSCPVAGGRSGREHGLTRSREAAKFRREKDRSCHISY
jgi:hypothetical protein